MHKIKEIWEKTDVGKYFVKRSIRDQNELPSNTLKTFVYNTKVFGKTT